MFADFETIAVGETRSLTKVIGEADVRRFVELTGDDNPLHVDRGFAATTSFKDIVVHGMLGASFLSTVIGTQLPGPGALWVSQNLEFLLPVRLGDELTVACTVTKKHERERLLELDASITNQNGQIVLTGRGRVKVLAVKPPAVSSSDQGRVRVALVTGGASGIGLEICRKLAASGHHIVLNYNTRREQAEEAVAQLCNDNIRAIAIQADVSDADGAERLIRTAAREFGGLDILVNAASPRINPKPFLDSAWDDFERHLNVQLKGAYLLTQACLPGMVERRWGRIVNIASQASEGMPTTGWMAYTTAKAALASFSRSLAAEVGPHGVAVNSVAPGMTETSLIGDIPEKLQMMVARQTPLRRLAMPSDVAAAVAYLASDDAAFVTGQVLRVNGGMVMA